MHRVDGRVDGRVEVIDPQVENIGEIPADQMQRNTLIALLGGKPQ